MKKLFVFLLVASMCFCTVACGNSTVGSTGELPSSTTPSDIFPSDPTEALLYLKGKYGEDFRCEGVTHDGATFHCSSKSYPLIMVHTVASLVNRGINASDFVGKYADNGYQLQVGTAMQEYYEGYFTALGQCKVLVHMPLEVFPSEVNTHRSFADNRRLYPQYFMPEMYVVYDGTLEDATLSAVRDAMRIANEYGTVYFIKSAASRWDTITMDTVLWNTESLTITHQLKIS